MNWSQKAIEDFEDELLAQQAEKILFTLDPKDNISWEEACRLAGWDEEDMALD